MKAFITKLNDHIAFFKGLTKAQPSNTPVEAVAKAEAERAERIAAIGRKKMAMRLRKSKKVLDK